MSGKNKETNSSPPDPLRQIINDLPLTPGIYLMKDAEGEILYIGKARSLRDRVRSYLINRFQFPKLNILMSKVVSIDYIETATEVDALLLEAKLIQKYQGILCHLTFFRLYFVRCTNNTAR